MCIRERIPQWLYQLGLIFHKHGYPLYLVGGFVRNAILHIEETDYDIAGPASPQEVISLLSNYDGYKVIPKAVDFGTIEIHFHFQGRNHITEYTTFRREKYDGSGTHVPQSVAFTASLEEDALRRDFSVNCLYYHITEDIIEDPTGGLEDIRHKMIRTTSKDPYLIFKDDGLRLLRMVRFACQLGFSIDRCTYLTAKKNIFLLRDISKERIRDEFVKIVLSDMFYPSLHSPGRSMPHERGISYLMDLGALPYIIPELFDSGRTAVNQLDVYAASPPILPVRLAALFQEWLPSKKSIAKDGGSEEAKGNGDLVRDIMGQAGLRFDSRTICRTALLMENNKFDWDNGSRIAEVRKKFCTIGEESARDLVELRIAEIKTDRYPEIHWKTIEKWKAVLEEIRERRIPIKQEDLRITGEQIMEILGEGPSPRIGQVKKHLWNRVMEHPEDNHFEALKKWVSNIRQEGLNGF